MTDTVPRSSLLRAATALPNLRLAEQLAISRAVPRAQVPLLGALGPLHALVAEYARAEPRGAVAVAWITYQEFVAGKQAGRLTTRRGELPQSELGLRAAVLGWLAQHYARAHPATLLGALYAVADARAELRGQGRLGAGEGGAGSRAFVAALDAAALDHDADAALLAVAQAIYGEVAGLAIPPDPLAQRPLRELVHILNPSAGRHGIPNDLREIAAAVRAGERSWAEFPYYGMRYAGRGVRFTWSDSAWIATQCVVPGINVTGEVAWLGRLLATRGMPQWLLERHLVVLHEELVRAMPSDAPRYASLTQAAAQMAADRTARLGEARSAALAAAFDAAVGLALARRLPEAGMLIAAAAADERAGISGALTSLVSWLADPTRFPPDWVDAVMATAKAALDSADA